MTYPGNQELSAQAQERVMSAFRQVVAKIQDGLSSEALIGLEFVLRLDPTFAPGVALQEQLINGQSDIDLSAIIAQVETPDTDAFNLLLIEAVEEFNQHNYIAAREKVEKVLFDLPGHAEARSLAGQIDDAMKVATQVGQFLTQAKEALAGNRPQDAANFVLMAQALDPHHSGIEATLAEIHQAGVAAKNFEGGDDTPVDQMPAAGVAPPSPSVAVEPPVEMRADSDDQPAPPLFQSPADDPVPAENAFATSGGFSTALAGQTESDSWDVAGAFEESAPGPESDDEPPAESDDFELGGNVADLFETSDDSESPLWKEAEPLPSQPPVEDIDPVDDLLAQGTAAMEAGEPQEALDVLSRILLIDPENSLAEALIDRARAAMDAVEQQLLASLSESEMAWESGDKDQARAVIDAVLAAAPTNEDALALKARFSADGADAPAPEGPPVDPVDPLLPPVPEGPSPLDFDSQEDINPLQDFDSAFDQLSTDPQPTAAENPIQSAVRRLPWRWLILGAGALAVVLAGMWLGSSFLPQGSEDLDTARIVSERIESAQLLFDQGKGEEALDHLRSFEVDGIDKQRIDKHIARFEKAMTPPTPTPVPESVARGRLLLDEGHWFEAYQAVDLGLSEHPGDSGLLVLKDEIIKIEPNLAALFTALAKSDFQNGARLAGELERRHPDQKEFGVLFDRCLFNAALTHLRAYNLTGARTHLKVMQERNSGDEDVSRILAFISTYTNRPVDMQLEIFVGSLDFR